MIQSHKLSIVYLWYKPCTIIYTTITYSRYSDMHSDGKDQEVSVEKPLTTANAPLLFSMQKFLVFCSHYDY